jgi:hypothetical protein
MTLNNPPAPGSLWIAQTWGGKNVSFVRLLNNIRDDVDYLTPGSIIMALPPTFHSRNRPYVAFLGAGQVGWIHNDWWTLVEALKEVT